MPVVIYMCAACKPLRLYIVTSVGANWYKACVPCCSCSFVWLFGFLAFGSRFSYGVLMTDIIVLAFPFFEGAVLSESRWTGVYVYICVCGGGWV